MWIRLAALPLSMKNPKRSISYLAEYQFGDDNLLTATHHEELRIRNEARLRQVQSTVKLRDVSLQDDEPTGLNNAKRLQQEQGVV